MANSAQYIRQGLIDRGFAPHVADAFIVNFQDESGLNPGVNEAKPIVPGSRGGYGLYQLTGPRRRQYESFAQSRGAPLDDIDSQLDFLKYEINGPEAKAGAAIMAAPDQATAAQAIVNDFLRPSEEHRSRRAARYANLSGEGVVQPSPMMGSMAATSSPSPSALPQQTAQNIPVDIPQSVLSYAGQGATKAADVFGQLAASQPQVQFSPVQIQGPSAEQANALSTLLASLRNRSV